MTATFPDAKYVDAGGVRLAVYEAGPTTSAPPVVLVHGWPEIAYSWKNQLHALAAAGRRAIAFDLKGFGRSDAPREVDAYNVSAMTGDFVRLLDGLGIDQAVFCGHDWGGALVWPMAQLHPTRVAGVIGVCTPHKPPPPAPPLSIIRKRFGEAHYFIVFQEPGRPESVFEGREDRFFRLMFRRPLPRSEWPNVGARVFDIVGRFENGPDPDPSSLFLSESDLAVYIEAYRNSGFHGGANLYRNVDRNYEVMRTVDPVIRKPALWIGADLDMFLPVETAGDMDALIPDLESRVIPECGHWVMWEKPDALNRLLIDWLDRRFPQA